MITGMQLRQARAFTRLSQADAAAAAGLGRATVQRYERQNGVIHRQDAKLTKLVNMYRARGFAFQADVIRPAVEIPRIAPRSQFTPTTLAEFCAFWGGDDQQFAAISDLGANITAQLKEPTFQLNLDILAKLQAVIRNQCCAVVSVPGTDDVPHFPFSIGMKVIAKTWERLRREAPRYAAMFDPEHDLWTEHVMLRRRDAAAA